MLCDGVLHRLRFGWMICSLSFDVAPWIVQDHSSFLISICTGCGMTGEMRLRAREYLQMGSLPDRVQQQLPRPMEVQPWLLSLARTGKLTLAVDGLDEIEVHSEESRAAAIAAFLQHCPQVHCVIAGRPYAIQEHYWYPLFTQAQLEVLRTLSREQLESLRSLADVYWAGVSRSVLADGVTPERNYHTGMTAVSGIGSQDGLLRYFRKSVRQSGIRTK